MSKPVPIEGYQGLGDPQRMERMRRERAREAEEFQRKKAEIEQEGNKKSVESISSKFGVSRSTAVDQKFTTLTTGLVTVEEFKRKRENIQELHEAAQDKERILREEAKEAARQRRMDSLHSRAKVAASSKLSFDLDDGGNDSEGGGSTSGVESDSGPARKKLSKNPTVDTSFLPDRHREEEEKREREKLKKEYQDKVAKMKAEKLEITFSYWDGTGHRRQITVTKGHTIERFLEDVRKSLQEEFRELRGVPADNLIYIKEDLIMPHHLTFHDLIISKARGKSGPLFHFDVHDDVRLQADARVEKDESHAGKVVERHWYERNKHIFPASRWEVYDPQKSYGSYTIKDTLKDK